MDINKYRNKERQHKGVNNERRNYNNKPN